MAGLPRVQHGHSRLEVLVFLISRMLATIVF